MDQKRNQAKTPLHLHGLRLAFPPLATLGILVMTEWIARGSLTAETFTKYIFPHGEAYLLAWALLFLVWLSIDWLTRFAPLATLVAAVLGCAPAAVNFYTLQLRGEPFLPWDLAQVSEAAGVASAAGIHIQTSMVVSIIIIILLVVLSLTVPALAASSDAAAPAAAAETTQTQQESTTGSKSLAAGIAIGLAAAGGAIAMGVAVSKSTEGIARQPEAEGKIRTTLMLGLVFIETAIIYALLVVILIIFVL